MKRITKARIESCFGPQRKISRQFFGGWWVELESGASVKITRKMIDFGKFKEVENRADIDEWVFQDEVKASLELGKEIWGGIRVFGEGKTEDRTAMLEYAASNGIDTGDQGLVLRHFGPNATFKYGWLRIEITAPNGFVKITSGAIVDVKGDAEMFSSALRMMHELLPNNVIVRGKAPLVAMGSHLGRLQNIDVIPEDPLEAFYAIVGIPVQLAGIGLACYLFETWQAAIAGWAAGLGLCMLGGCVFGKQLQAMARRRGLEIRGLDPTVRDKGRNANIDDARRQGML